jgi:sodium-dependent dicarboxylate transporter 2/3/5
MADSRSASHRVLYMQRVMNYQLKIIYFLSSILLAMFLTFQLRDPAFSETQNYVLFLLFFAIGLWVTEAVPPFAVGIMIVGFLVFFLGSDYFNTNPESVKIYVNTWSDSVIWLMLGGFFLAQGLKKVGLDLDIFRLAVKRFGSSPRWLLLGLMLATALASMVMSNTATAAMMIAAIGPLLSSLPKENPLGRSLLLGIATAASIGGMGTIIGSPVNAIAVGSLGNIGIKISFIGWMAVGVPITIVLLMLYWWFLIRKYPLGEKKLDLSLLLAESNSPDKNVNKERKIRKQIVLSILGVTVLLWLTNSVSGIPIAAASGVPIIMLTMLGIINGDDVRKLPWDTLMLITGGLSLGLAIQETGLAEHFVKNLQGMSLSITLLLITFGLITVLLSNFMSNTAAATVLIPLAMIIYENNPTLMALAIGLCASCAVFLPVSTPPNAIAFSTGRLEQMDFRFGGILLGILGPTLIILWVSLVT